MFKVGRTFKPQIFPKRIPKPQEGVDSKKFAGFQRELIKKRVLRAPGMRLRYHNADLTVIPMKYAQTSKLNIYRILQFLKSFHVRNIVGFLYNVNNKHYTKVTL